VASSRPPSPASTTATSTPRAANSANAAAQIASNCVAPARGELGDRGRADRLERRRALRLRLRPHAREGGLEAGRLPSHRDPLAPLAHVRRDGRADRQAFGEEQRLDRPRRRRLAVRADDVDRRIDQLRVAQRRQQRPHPPQPELLRPRAQAL
jgi:hypothetical protein